MRGCSAQLARLSRFHGSRLKSPAALAASATAVRLLPSGARLKAIASFREIDAVKKVKKVKR